MGDWCPLAKEKCKQGECVAFVPSGYITGLCLYLRLTVYVSPPKGSKDETSEPVDIEARHAQ